jgi:hypothetical protein
VIGVLVIGVLVIGVLVIGVLVIGGLLPAQAMAKEGRTLLVSIQTDL